jgi:drug/metabolite transporter (DMT)-like permease
MQTMEIRHEKHGLGILALAATAFCWSLAGLFIKLVDWHPFAIAFGRSSISALFLLMVARKPRFTFSMAQWGAALGSAATMMLFIYANKVTTSANAILLQYGAPIYTGILGAFILKERPRLEHWLGFVAVAGGMALFFIGDIGGGSFRGDLAAVVSGVTFAFYFIFMRMQKDGSPLESNILAHLVTAATGLGVSLFLPFPAITVKALVAIAVLGILQNGLAAVFFSWGIKRVSAVEGILIVGLEPVFNPLWVFLIIGERPGINTLAGGAVIILAVIAVSIVSATRIRRDGRIQGARVGRRPWFAGQ